MLAKPRLKDEIIKKHILDNYKLSVTNVSFIPIGADFNTSVYKIITNDKFEYFLKLRSEDFLEASVSISKYLADLGVKQVIPPIETNSGKLWESLESFSAILYPYVDGFNGTEVKLSEYNWKQFGSTIKKLHTANIPNLITKDVPRERFSSMWRQTVKEFMIRIENEVFEEPVAVKMALFLNSKKEIVIKLVENAENLVVKLQKQYLEYVLCHADIHGWNLIIDKENAIYIVDWDTLIFSPKERDLMFIGAGIWDSGRTPEEDIRLFYKGYGKTEINYDILAYYRFERIIQDVGEYCELIFLSDKGGNARMQYFEHLQQVFMPNAAIERAYASYNTGELL